jgi:hypothetical protein
MTSHARLLLAAVVAFCAALAFACSDDEGDANGDGTPATDAGTSRPTTDGSADVTPGSFEEARDDLVARLEDYSATIGSLPDDVLADLLADCEALAQRSGDAESALEICDEIEQAANTGDPGLVDRAIDGLSELEGG